MIGLGPLAALATVLVAQGHWHDRPACGQPRVIERTIAASDAGRAYHDRCVIVVNRRMFPEEWPYVCAVVVHEYGHLLGHDHGDPDPVMDPEPEPPAECRRRTAWFE